MAKASLVESRRGFSGGLNIAAASDMLDDDELLQCVNARIDQYGGVMRRPGSVILNAVPLNEGQVPINAVYQWMESPDTFTAQVIAISGTTLFRCPAPYTADFTGGATFSHGIPGHANFALFRDSASAAIKVFIAAHSKLYKWDGTTLTLLSGTNSVPDAWCCRVFGTRLFVSSNDKTIYWSKIGVGDDFGTGGISDGGSALVDLLGGPFIEALEVVGGSLLIATSDSIARFTGTADDIRIAQDTQGVSAEIGSSSIYGFLRMDQVAFLHSERGLYAVTEGGALNIGKKVFAPNQIALRMTSNIIHVSGRQLTPILGSNPRRTEAWYAYAPVGGTERTHVLVYNYSLQCWSGPFIYPFGITCFGTFEDEDGVEQIMAGCEDGHIRLLDDPGADSFDDGETDFDCTMQPAPFGLKAGPRSTKALRHVFLQVIGDHTFTVTATGELGLTDVGAFVT